MNCRHYNEAINYYVAGFHASHERRTWTCQSHSISRGEYISVCFPVRDIIDMRSIYHRLEVRLLVVFQCNGQASASGVSEMKCNP